MISISKDLAKLSFAKFKVWHKQFLSHDTETAEKRYKEIGGSVPKKKKEGGN